jgi:L-fuconolactonase
MRLIPVPAGRQICRAFYCLANSPCIFGATDIATRSGSNDEFLGRGRLARPVPYVVDANAHVVRAEPVPPGFEAPEREDATAEELLSYMRQASVQQALLVPHPQSSYDNTYCTEAAQRYPDAFVAVGKIDAVDPEAAAVARRLVEQSHVGGLRLDASGREDPLEWLAAPRTLAIWEIASLEGLSISLPTVRRLDHLPLLRGLLDQFPDVPVILMHGIQGVPVDNGPPYDEARDFFALAEVPNLYLAVTQHNLDDTARGKSTPQAFFEILVSRFGANRLLWASFFPARAPADAPLKGLLDPVLEGLSFLPQTDFDWILGETARGLYPALGHSTDS